MKKRNTLMQGPIHLAALIAGLMRRSGKTRRKMR